MIDKKKGTHNGAGVKETKAIGDTSIPGAGVLNGPGTGTSDSIKATLPVGDAIIPAKATRKIGKDVIDKLIALAPTPKAANTAKETVPANVSKGETRLPDNVVKFLGKPLVNKLINYGNDEKKAVTTVKDGVINAAGGIIVPTEEEINKGLGKPAIDWVETPKPSIQERAANVDTVARNEAQNAPLREKLGEPTPGMGARLNNSAISSADQAAQLRNDLSANAGPKQQPELLQRMPVANDAATAQAQSLRGTITDNNATGALKGRMDAAQDLARQGAHDIRNTTGLGFQGQNGEIPQFSDPKFGRISPSSAINAQSKPLDPWVTGQNVSAPGQVAKTPLGRVGQVIAEPVNAALAGDAINEALLNRNPSNPQNVKGDVFGGNPVTSLAMGRGAQAIAKAVTGGISPDSVAAKVGDWATKPLPIFANNGTTEAIQQPVANQVGPDTRWDKLTPEQQAEQVKKGNEEVQRQLADPNYAPRALELLRSPEGQQAYTIQEKVRLPDGSIGVQSVISPEYGKTIADLQARLTPEQREQEKALSEGAALSRKISLADQNAHARIESEKADAPMNELLRQQRLQGELTLEQQKQGMQIAKDMSVLNPTYSVQNLGDGKYATIRNDPNMQFNPAPGLGNVKQIPEVLQERQNAQATLAKNQQERADKFLPVQTTNSDTGETVTRQTLPDGYQQPQADTTDGPTEQQIMAAQKLLQSGNKKHPKYAVAEEIASTPAYKKYLANLNGK